MLTFDPFDIETPHEIEPCELATLLDRPAHTIDNELALKQGEN
jgi:hypothetical protein